MPPHQNAGFPTRSAMGGIADALGGLLSWWPMQTLLALLVIALLAGPLLGVGLPGIGGTVQISAEGAKGEIIDGHYHLDLPLRLRNSTESPIFQVSLKVRAFACGHGAVPLVHCRLVVAAGQFVPMKLAPGASSHFSGSLDGLAPAGIADGPLRVTSEVETVEDGNDRQREADRAAPAPDLSGAGNDLQDKVDRSIMPS